MRGQFRASETRPETDEDRQKEKDSQTASDTAVM